ncbi:MAG TPA: hypothetical protein PL017_00675 [Tenuifilaceae bacterium]|nr:hypothetical protein [Tenuifilaceae bacterium]HPE18057.1 hypothetical protein [Tenuifilaceae bacterium]HPJ44580.1 hypothetical protein [Tenuifilaceae bacterium]HPQ34468.1 hypothetical protein [Tenuifilaceae bacterium]HRX68779.1 hypothetical protein [Tenuifilaceae bacterium]
MVKIIQLFLLLFFISSTSIFGQGLFSSATTKSDSTQTKRAKVEINGYVRGSGYGGAKNYDLTNVFGEFALKSKFSSENTFLFADFRVREGVFYNQRDIQFQLKEAYIGYKGESLDVYAGNQIVSWGRTDGFNPTNSITPNDYFLLTYEPDDQKMSNFMVRTKYRLNNSIDIDLIAIPFYLSSIYRYDLFNIQPGVSYSEIDLPSSSIKNGSVAARLNFEFPALGFSTSYFNGYDPYYGFQLKEYSVIPLSINYAPAPYRKQAAGLDFTLPVRSWIIRGEAAYNITNDYEQEMYIPNPDIYYVAGLEKSFFDITAIVQYIGKYTFNFKELTKPSLGGFTQEDFIQYGMEMIPYESEMYNRKIFNQQEETNHAVMLSLSRSFLYETLRTELSGYYNFTSEEYFLHGRLEWNISDNLSTNVGAHYMFGPENSLYNMSGNVLNGVFAGMEVNF